MHAWDGVQFYMSMMTEEDQTFECHVEYLHDAFHLGETLSKLISNFCGCAQKTREIKDTFLKTSRC